MVGARYATSPSVRCDEKRVRLDIQSHLDARKRRCSLGHGTIGEARVSALCLRAGAPQIRLAGPALLAFWRQKMGMYPREHLHPASAARGGGE